MPVAEYRGTAATYRIGPHVFAKDDPKSLIQNVDDNIAKFLTENPAFSIDGKGGVRTVASEDDPVDRPIVPADGFKNRDEVLAFAGKWLPKLQLDPLRSTAELQRRVEAELLGLQVDEQGEVLKASAGAQLAKAEKVAPKTKVAV